MPASYVIRRSRRPTAHRVAGQQQRRRAADEVDIRSRAPRCELRVECMQKSADARCVQARHARCRAVSVMNTPRMRNCAGDCTIAQARP